jgi:anti-sigma regulatory factor (Ser/Thr protein kinase)
LEWRFEHRKIKRLAAFLRELMTVLPGPLTSYLKLAATPDAVSYARQHAKQEILEWNLPELADTAELLVSELVTNAVKATRDLEPQDQGSSPYRERPSIVLWLTSEQGAVIIRVWDNSSQMPVRRDAGLYAEGGRGVALVAAIANDWGAYRKLLGKVTWCMLASNSDGVAMKDERKHRLAAVMGARYYPTEPASPWFTPAATRGGRRRRPPPEESAAEL